MADSDPKTPDTGKIRTLQSETHNMAERLNDFESKISTMETRILAKIDELRNEFDQRFVTREDLDQRDRAIGERFEQRFRESEIVRQAMEGQLTTTVTMLTEAGAKVAAMETNITTLLGTVPGLIESRDSQIESIAQRTAKHDERINELAQSAARANALVDKTRGAVFGDEDGGEKLSLMGMVRDNSALLQTVADQVKVVADWHNQTVAAQTAKKENREKMYKALAALGPSPLVWRILFGVITAIAAALGYDTVIGIS